MSSLEKEIKNLNIELLKNRLQFKEDEDQLIIPDNLFRMLKDNIKPNHITFAYSYYCMVTYLYKYAKYKVHLYNNEDIKELLGYHKLTKGLDYLIKKNGLLEQLGLIKTVKDFPIDYHYKNGSTHYIMYSESEEKKIMSRKYSVKFPINLDSSTHKIPVEVFLFCISQEDIGCNGFYLYSYMDYMSTNKKYSITINQLSECTQLSVPTIKRILGNLKAYRLVNYDLNNGTFTINGYTDFSSIPQSYDKGKMSSWHIEWQDRFDDSTKEIILKTDNETHRADIHLSAKGKGITIEFQNSPISEYDIMKRSRFYNKHGIIIWMFNLKNKGIVKCSSGMNDDFLTFKWPYATRSIPTTSQLEGINAFVCFQIEDDKILIPTTLHDSWSNFKCYKNDVISKNQFIERVMNGFFNSYI